MPPIPRLPLVLRAALALMIAIPLSLSAADVGINLPENSDYTPALAFNDAIKSARGWARPDKRYQPGGVALDANGWPAEDAAIVLHASVKGLAGEYRVEFEGKASLAAPDGGVIERLSYDAAKNRGTAILVVPEGQTLVSLVFTGTKDGVRDVRVLRPGAGEGVFHPAFLRRLAPFSTLRLMDWQRTNASPQSAWGKRPPPERALWTGAEGVPLEVCVDLANQTRKNVWLCVPHLADDDYVRAMARLVRDRLDPALTVYAEYSNELWNFQFKQTQHYKDQAMRWFDAEVAAGRALEADRNKLAYPHMWGLVAGRTAQVLRIWREEFAAKPRAPKLATVLGAQAANSFIARTQLASPGLVAQLDALAIAPYFAHDHGYSKKADTTLAGGLDGLFAELQKEVGDANKRWITQHADLARKNGLALIAYEGGQHLVVGSGDKERDKRLFELFREANRDPRMGRLYLDQHRNWAEAGGGLHVYFNLMSLYGNWGFWGLSETMAQTPEEAPKLKAVLDIIAAP